MSKFLQNKMLLGGICVFIAAIFSFILLPNIYKNQGKTTTIIKLVSDIESGVKIEENMLKEVEVGSYGLPENVISKKAEIIGKIAKMPVLCADILIESKFSDNSKIMADGKKLVSVTVLTSAASVSNQIKVGDIVSVISYVDNNIVVFPELKNLEIYNITITENEGTVTFIADEIQAQKLVYAEYSGKVHIIFEKGGTVK